MVVYRYCANVSFLCSLFKEQIYSSSSLSTCATYLTRSDTGIRRQNAYLLEDQFASDVGTPGDTLQLK